jgi:hypothetical protein
MEQQTTRVYRPYFDSVFAVIIFFLLGVFIASLYLRGGNVQAVLLGGFLYVGTITVIMVLPLFSFVKVDPSNRTLTYRGIVGKRVVAVEDVVEISDLPTYVVFANAFRTLDIAYTQGSTTKHIRLRLTQYKPETIKALINELKELNPRIAVTKHS